MTFQKSELLKISVSSNSRPSSPTKTLLNPLQKDIFVNGIELILTPEFAKKGKIIVLVNDVAVFSESESEVFRSYSKFPIPLGKELKRSFCIEVYAWNGTDTNTIKADMNISISENLQPFNSQAVPMNIADLNNVVSQKVALFAKQNYHSADSPFYSLLDLEGFKRFWAIMSAQNYISPSISDELLWTHTNNYSVDGDLTATNKDSSSASGLGGDTHYLVYDFGDIDTRIAKAFVQYHAGISGGIGTSVVTINLYVSTDGITWGSAVATVSQTGTGATTTQDATLTAPSQSLRYVKVEYVWTRTLNVSNANNVGVYECYDANAIGGTAALSFELKDSEGDWFEIIASSEFGTVTQGNAVAVQVGDTLTKKYALPSTQSDFRAKLTVTGGGISTGVTTELVA